MTPVSDTVTPAAGEDGLCPECGLPWSCEACNAPTHPDDDFGAECGRWLNGRLMASCTKAGSEECDWECPYGR